MKSRTARSSGSFDKHEDRRQLTELRAAIDQSMVAEVRAAQATARAALPRDRRRSSRGVPYPEPFPLVLHRNAGSSRRVHAARTLHRLAVLVAFDGLVLLGFRWGLRAVRDLGVLGADAAALASLLIPATALDVGQTVCAVFLGLFLLRNYLPGDYRRNPQALFTGAALGLALVWWSRLWSDPSVWAVTGYVAAVVVLAGALVIERVLVDAFVRRVRPVGGNAARTLLVGTAREVARAGRSPALTDTAECIVAGFLDVAATPSPDALGGVGELVRAIAAHRVDTVVIAGNVDEAVANYVVDVADAAGCHVYKLPQEVDGDFVPRLHWWHGVPLIELTRPGIRQRHLVLKRVIDAFAAASALVLLAPAFLLVALAVRLSSPGPILFRQERVGIRGRRFHIYKFRTMVRDAEIEQDALADRSLYADPRLFKVQDDPRVTRVGRWLRRTSLDELPQLWNVLRGDMSLVGPRPPIPSEVELYEERHYRRFVMRPGMTGPWQVSGRNNVTDFEEVIRLESAYMRNWSLRKDFQIMLRTVPAVLRMDGAH